VLGWDEAFLGIDHDQPERTAHDIQRRVGETTQLDCTVGIGQNKLQAKLATGFGKPAGVFRLTDETWFEVMGERPTDALWGIGSKTAKRLAGLGIRTVNALAAADPSDLARHLGPMTGPWLVSLAHGKSSSHVTGEPYVARSLSRETTFQRDIEDWDVVRREVADIAVRVAQDIAPEGRPAVRVVVKVRFIPFTTRTRGQALAEPSHEPDVIAEAALAALDRFTRRRPVRLLGVRAEFAVNRDDLDSA
jgi:nucleotidyltransferase/DNA polymerase involved in DNA repair